MPSRDDLDNGIDSLASTSNNRNTDENPEVVQEWNNPLYGKLRLLKNGVIEYKDSVLTTNQKNRRTPWIPLRDNLVVSSQDTPELSRHQWARTRLAREILKTKGTFNRKEEDLWTDKLKYFSLLDLEVAQKKLYGKPANAKKNYIDYLTRQCNKAADTRNKQFPQEWVGNDDFGNEQKLRYCDYNIFVAPSTQPSTGYSGKVRAVSFDTKDSERSTSELVTAWFSQEEDGKWKLFDGFRSGQGKVSLDSMKSQLFLEYGLIDQYKRLSSLVDKMPQDQIDAEELTCTTDEFNDVYAGVRHVPTTDPEELQSWFTRNAVDIKDFNTGFVNISLLEDAAKFELFNHVDEIGLDNLDSAADFIKDHFYIPVGHPNPTDPSVKTSIEQRNSRGTSTSDPHFATGWQRPVFKDGTSVPYNAMTSEERGLFRQHWDNQYDRVLGWLHHTEEGRTIWDETVARHHMDDQQERDLSFVRNEFTKLGIPIDEYNKFTDGVLKGQTVEEVCNQLTEEDSALDQPHLRMN